jgi:ADP-heptose:LPS heptosyltransferase
MKILLIIQRSNGDVFLTLPLIRGLQGHYPNCQIDMLVNDDTLAIAKTFSIMMVIDNPSVFKYMLLEKFYITNQELKAHKI